MNEVNKTLYIPLYGKSFVSKKGVILADKKAEGIWEKAGFSLKGKAKSKWLAYYMGMRSAVFDNWLREKTNGLDDYTILHLGCGLDSRIERVGNFNAPWYDGDFAEVIAERRKYYKETPSYHMIEIDLKNGAWLNQVAPSKRAIVVMEG